MFRVFLNFSTRLVNEDYYKKYNAVHSKHPDINTSRVEDAVWPGPPNIFS